MPLVPHTQTVTVEIHREGSVCFIPVPFDPRKVFGKTRAPVRVTVNGYMYRSTIATMGGVYLVPLRKSNREAAGLSGGEILEVTFELDAKARAVTVPPELSTRLRAKPHLAEAWRSLSYSRRREYAESIASAIKPDTRARRIAKALAALAASSIKVKS